MINIFSLFFIVDDPTCGGFSVSGLAMLVFIGSEVMKVGFQVAYGEFFKMMSPCMTLTKSQGHILYLKVRKNPMFVTILFLQHLDTFICNSIMKLEQKVACGPDLQNHVTLDNLDLRQCSYFRYMKF